MSSNYFSSLPISPRLQHRWPNNPDISISSSSSASLRTLLPIFIQKWVCNLQVNHDDPEYRSLMRFNSLWKAHYRHDSLLHCGEGYLSSEGRQVWKPCICKDIPNTGMPKLLRSNGYFIIEANGGLNQQRLSICDVVAVAGLLNVTLIIPIFHLNSDMVTFPCCEYDGGKEEKQEMDISRERSWRGNFRRRGRVIRPGTNRVDGKCPLTPLEVGMMLRGMGSDNTTSVYIAAGKIYKAEHLWPLLNKCFQGHFSILAAFGYTVCLHNEVFFTSQGGNFPHFLMGHRSDQKDIEMKKPSGSLYTFPVPNCMCKQAEAKTENNNMSTRHPELLI
ncbi:hypothetical protein UlMin_013768 [Ulmus minor]